MRNYILIIVFLLLVSCASIPREQLLVSEITLPPRPDVVMIDKGKGDTKKYPNTKWVSEPSMDSKKGIACWSYKDVQVISDGLADWQVWADAIESIVKSHNGGEINKDTAPWYKRWIR